MPIRCEIRQAVWTDIKYAKYLRKPCATCRDSRAAIRFDAPRMKLFLGKFDGLDYQKYPKCLFGRFPEDIPWSSAEARRCTEIGHPIVRIKAPHYAASTWILFQGISSPDVCDLRNQLRRRSLTSRIGAVCAVCFWCRQIGFGAVRAVCSEPLVLGKFEGLGSRLGSDVDLDTHL